jgi:thiamine pyrophosphokinase
MLRRRGVPTLQVPAAKDQTDTELALLAALEHGADEIVIAAGLGGRTDHLLANVSLLARAALHGCVVSLADGGETVRLAQTEAGPVVTVIPGAPGDLVSLLPYGADAEGITTEALLYPLYAETLRLGEARGVSNVMVSERAEVSLMRGRLLVIHYRMESE